MIILKMCCSVNQIDDLQSSNKNQSWTFRLPWYTLYIFLYSKYIHPCCYQQMPEEPSNSFEAFTSQGSPSLLYCTFSTDETLAFDVQMKSIGQKSLLTRRSFLPRFLPPSFSLKNKKIVLKVRYSGFLSKIETINNRNYQFWF